VRLLQEWEAAKLACDPDVPDHEVRIRVACGASAGGIVAAMLAMLPFTGHFPMRDLAEVGSAGDAANARRNLLYRSWVLETDLRQMLSTDDLDDGASQVPSLLNGRALSTVADLAIAQVHAALPPPRFIANPLQLYLCLTNMRGIPYVIRMISDDRFCGHRVQSHGDFAHFAVVGAGAEDPAPMPLGAIPLYAPASVAPAEGDGWTQLRDAALATSAFPGGFPARPFRNPASAYRNRPWIGLAGVGGCPSLAVRLDLAERDGHYDFWCVDGGLLNNEPLQLARGALRNASGRHTRRDARGADRAVLLIDPFPNGASVAPPGAGEAPDIVQALTALVPILRAHAAFKPDDLALALAEDVRTRFLLAPIRDTMGGDETPLASDGMAGFTGFAHEQLRLHDFQLGRRNCQKFLRDHFYLHLQNPLFGTWRKRAKAFPHRFAAFRPCIPGPDGSASASEAHAQIIPLVGSAREEVRSRAWPKLDRDADIRPLHKLIRRRADKVVPHLLSTAFDRAGISNRRLLQRLLGAVARDVLSDRAARSAALSLEQDLIRRNLM
jgi:hypothetical protein